ncbi:hypothetical protein AX16_003861 [Volvariella volvacea WC 439]|nr:hypothetical protein AX16_003861 [Volvariella volvacea WC 439]
MEEPEDVQDIEFLDEEDIDLVTVLGEHLINSILASEPRAIIEEILDRGAPVWYQNAAEGISCLHAAAYMQDTDLTRFLLERGALWNSVDYMKNTAGDIALSFNDTETYLAIRDAGIRSELVLALLGSKSTEQSESILQQVDTTGAGSTEAFLASKLRFTTDERGQEICFLTVEGGEEVGVMMGWERGIMEETVKKLYDGHGKANELRVLNVGFGLGIIDSLFQSLPKTPIKHVIVEPHPDVLQHMRKHGWYEKEGVEIIEAKWQDAIETHEILKSGGFDVVYTDTFSEDYTQLQRFFRHLPKLLAGPESRFSFFNGLGATNPLFYDVYTHIAELHLADIGLDVKWSDVDVTSNREERWGESREYFSVPIYRLPIANPSSNT